ncbi:MAG: aminotransferase class V-fold PLP-dependent enzyme [Clostridia bacterium]|nr:aminotransferase class V-fold PLP-dependent enzyme [Clostridia bacterium]
MKTPICDFVKTYAESGVLRAHMPGHKGVSLTGAEPRDITEVQGADVLYGACGIIRESEENARDLFGSGATFYSAEGSSLSVRAMLYLTLLYAKRQGRAPRILAARNAHRVFITAAALLDLAVEWLFGEGDLLRCVVTPEALEKTLSEADTPPAAVYITSPDYLGNVADVKALAEVCHRYGVLLLVDNAHGAYLRFLPEDRHPLTLGADLCCDSAHKTLPVLTGGGYLHISQNAPREMAAWAEDAMALFASTSPSYLILQSLDAANGYLADGYAPRLAAFAERTAQLKARLVDHGYTLAGDEPLKLTVLTKPYGYEGCDLAALLRDGDVECEFSDPDHLVLMLTPALGEAGLARIETALCAVEKREAIMSPPPILPRPRVVTSPRAALLAPSVELPVDACVGRTLANPTVSCPPAVPILVCGEQIDEAALACFRYYGIKTCLVVDE